MSGLAEIYLTNERGLVRSKEDILADIDSAERYYGNISTQHSVFVIIRYARLSDDLAELKKAVETDLEAYLLRNLDKSKTLKTDGEGRMVVIDDPDSINSEGKRRRVKNKMLHLRPAKKKRAKNKKTHR